MKVHGDELVDFLKKQKAPLSYIVAINVKNQIAMSMCNLHDMYIAHLDVKPDNVLVISMTIARVEGNCGHNFVILMVDDISKMEVQSNPKVQEYALGTSEYVTPEMKNKSTEDPPCSPCPLQANV